MTVAPVAALLLAVIASAPPGAPLDIAGFHYARDIAAAPAGLAAVRLDAAVLAHSDGLADLRIVDAGGRQVPYLRLQLEEPLRLLLPWPRRVGEKGAGAAQASSRYRFALPYATLPAARFVVGTTARVFAREVRVVRVPGPEPEHRRVRRESEETVAVAAWRHADPEAPAPDLTLDLPERVGAAIDLLVDDADNAALPLARPHLELSTARLLFYVPEGAAGRRLRLLYGKPGLAEPRYDLSLLAPRLAPAAARELGLREEKAIGRSDRLWPPAGALFWSALIAATVALLLVLARLLRPAPQPPG